MWHPIGSTGNILPDVARFIEQINQARHFFNSELPVTIARAPGRLDLMGGIADYSGSLVLELPLAAATLVAIQPTTDRTITIQSTTASEIGGTALVSFPLEALFPEGHALSYAQAHQQLTSHPEQAWAAYVAGVLIVLQHECGFTLSEGLRILIHCEVPIGKGVSSSAALEVATMQAINGLYNLAIEGREIAILCQKVENLIVGAPCGVMDQMTSACGEADSLLALLCQPAELQKPVSLPAEVEVWGIDSGIRHAVTGADYGSVRVGAFMGYRIIVEHAGLPVYITRNGQIEIQDDLWSGYLANISPSLWEMHYRQQVPAKLTGADFLQRFTGFTDSITHINPSRTYAVRQPTAHPIYEHQRVRLFRALLQQEVNEEKLILLGELMYQSHASYSACGLGSNGTDRLVELVRQAEPEKGLYGAKITGGGSGGTVAVLARKGAQDTIQRIVEQYEVEMGHRVTILHGSSPGAVSWGTLQLTAD